MVYRIAFFADAHIGYKTKVKSNDKGINIRLQDGYDAFRRVLSQILDEHNKTPVDSIIIGGDLFHSSKPSMRDITTVQYYLREVSKRKIPVYILAGNHDATDIRSELAAVAPINDPDKKIFTFIDPYSKVELADGIILHIVSHHGLDSENAPVVTPVEGVFNIFTTHGAALDPKNKTLMRCADSPREQFVPVEMIIDDSFVAKLLGHYHSRYAIGGESFNSWYSGSLIRRGFSDAPGDRGWLMVEIDNSQGLTITPHNIPQRPQYDLDVIDASSLTANDVMGLLEINLGRTIDEETRSSPIVRQRILNANRGVREGLDRAKINEMTAHMLSWQLEFPRSDKTKGSDGSVDDESRMSLGNKHSINVLASYKDWVKSVSDTVPEEYRDVVVKDAEQYIKDAHEAGLTSQNR